MSNRRATLNIIECGIGPTADPDRDHDRSHLAIVIIEVLSATVVFGQSCTTTTLPLLCMSS